MDFMPSIFEHDIGTTEQWITWKQEDDARWSLCYGLYLD